MPFSSSLSLMYLTSIPSLSFGVQTKYCKASCEGTLAEEEDPAPLLVDACSPWSDLAASPVARNCCLTTTLKGFLSPALAAGVRKEFFAFVRGWAW